MQRFKPAFGIAAILVAVNIFLLRPVAWKNNTGKSDEHTIPTLLSAVDEKTGQYVYALENPLYEKLWNGNFIRDYQHDVVDIPELHLDQTEIELRGALSLSWTLGLSKTGKPIVSDTDLIVLYCDEQLWNEEPDRFMDAATVAQAKAASVKHGRSEMSYKDHGGDSWYFPSFPVIRHEVCQFMLYKSLPGNTFAHLASSQPLHIRDGKSTPTAIYLALGNSIDEMVVQFKTGTDGGKPVVKYGENEESLQLSATGRSHSYTAKDMCQKPATEEKPGKFQPPGMMHVVRLTGLKTNTTYYYKVGVEGDGSTVWSKSYSFVSAPEIAANTGPFAYVVYGDQGCPSVGWGQGGTWTAAMTARETRGDVSSLPISAVHHFGDLSYARGAAHIWDEWLNMISSFTTRVPLMVSVGNHEYDHTKGGENGKDPSGVPTAGGYKPRWGNFATDSGGECGVPTANHFIMPNGTHSNGVFWYSYDYGNVHTVVISSEHDLSPGSRQHLWLEEDLKSVNRTKLPWLVLELHRPMYESEPDPANYLVGFETRRRIEGLLKQYQVDLVLGGHYHSYERSCDGLYKGKCNDGGPVHITIGTAGAKLNRVKKIPLAKWTAKFIKGTYGYGRITVANASALHFEFIQAGGVDDPNAGRVLDETWIIKDLSLLTPGSTVEQLES